MLTDPLTLGISGNSTTFRMSENGPGARTIRVSSLDVDVFGAGLITALDETLTVSHSPAQSGKRIRSVFRIDVGYNSVGGISNGFTTDLGEAAAYLVVDTPGPKAPGGNYRELAAKFALSRILGFLSENATGAPDFDFSSNEELLRFLGGEP